jgi:hypothetical protein
VLCKPEPKGWSLGSPSTRTSLQATKRKTSNSSSHIFAAINKRNQLLAKAKSSTRQISLGTCEK